MSNNNKVTNQTQLMCRITRTIGGLVGKQIQHSIDCWIKNSGKSWTSDRLKTIRNVAYLLKEGRSSAAISLMQGASISYDSQGYPKGPFKPIIRNFVTSKQPAVVKRAGAMLRTYTALSDDYVTAKAWKKGLKTITEPAPDTDKYHEALSKAKLYVDLGLEAIGYDSKHERGHKDRTSPSVLILQREDFSLSNLKPYTMCYSPFGAPTKEIGKLPYGHAMHSLLTTYSLPNEISMISEPARNAVRVNRKALGPSINQAAKDTLWAPLLRVFSSSLQRGPITFHSTLKDVDTNEDPVGRVAILREFGCKPRIIAIPNAWVQLHMYPLHKALTEYEKFIPNSHTSRQPQAAEEIKLHMRQGGFVKSVDLSSATDRFPLELQTHFLEKVGQPAYAKAIRRLSRESTWEYPEYPQTKSDIKRRHRKGPAFLISYNKGQPMGMYGSFPLFNATHALLLLGIEKQLEKEGRLLNRCKANGHCSFVLGDDVVITDKRICQTYMHLMSKLDVPISKHKSFSGPVTEFAGFTFMKLGKDKRTAKYVGFRPLKYTDDLKKLTQIDTMYSLGNRYKNLMAGSKLHDQHIEAYKAFTSTLPERYMDLSPILGTDEDQNPVGVFNMHDMKSITLPRLYNAEKNGLYPNYDSLIGGEPLFYDGPRSNIALRFHQEMDEKPLTRETNRFEYKAPQYSRDPLICDKIAENHREEELRKKVAKLVSKEGKPSLFSSFKSNSSGFYNPAVSEPPKETAKDLVEDTVDQVDGDQFEWYPGVQYDYADDAEPGDPGCDVPPLRDAKNSSEISEGRVVKRDKSMVDLPQGQGHDIDL